jgi:putative membrane protein
MKAQNIMILVVMVGFWTSLPGRAEESPRYLKAQQFLSHLHHTNQMEIKMGQMAEQKGNSVAVRVYGSRLIQDRQNADKGITVLAQKYGFTLEAPSTSGFLHRLVAARERNTMSDLAKKTGTEFDKAFAGAIDYQQKLDSNQLESAEYSFKEADISDLVARLIPMQMQHQEWAAQIVSIY